MKQYTFFLSILLFFFLTSCEKEALSNEENISVVNGRLVFSSSRQFEQTLGRVSKIEDEEKFRKKFLESEFTSLRSLVARTKSDTFPFPSCYYNLLNSNLEYQVADTVYRYDMLERVKFAIPLKELDEFKNIDTKTRNKYIVARFQIDSPTTTNSKSGRVTMNGNALDGRHQKEFFQERYLENVVRGRRKYVHELMTYSERIIESGLVMRVKCYSYLLVKMEWMSSSGWKDAGEIRYVTLKINGDSHLSTTSDPVGWVDPVDLTTPVSNRKDFSFNTLAIASGVHKIELQRFSYISPYQDHYFNITVSGSIEQLVVGDLLSNSWNNTGNPLW